GEGFPCLTFCEWLYCWVHFSVPFIPFWSAPTPGRFCAPLKTFFCFFPVLKTRPSGIRGIAHTRFLPKAKPSQECIGVVTRAATWRELFQFLDVASSQNHLLGFQSGNEARYHVRDFLPPLFFA